MSSPDPAALPAALQQRELQSVCPLLRTKSYFGAFTAEDHDWTMADSSTASYWCLATQSTAGPDDALAHPHICRHGRACFQRHDD